MLSTSKDQQSHSQGGIWRDVGNPQHPTFSLPYLLLVDDQGLASLPAYNRGYRSLLIYWPRHGNIDATHLEDNVLVLRGIIPIT